VSEPLAVGKSPKIRERLSAARTWTSWPSTGYPLPRLIAPRIKLLGNAPVAQLDRAQKKVFHRLSPTHKRSPCSSVNTNVLIQYSSEVRRPIGRCVAKHD